MIHPRFCFRARFQLGGKSRCYEIVEENYWMFVTSHGTSRRRGFAWCQHALPVIARHPVCGAHASRGRKILRFRPARYPMSTRGKSRPRFFSRLPDDDNRHVTYRDAFSFRGGIDERVARLLHTASRGRLIASGAGASRKGTLAGRVRRGEKEKERESGRTRGAHGHRPQEFS